MWTLEFIMNKVRRRASYALNLLLPGTGHFLLKGSRKRGLVFFLIGLVNLYLLLTAASKGMLSGFTTFRGPWLPTYLLCGLLILNRAVAFQDIKVSQSSELYSQKGEVREIIFKLFRNPKGLTGVTILIVMVYLATFSPFISPYDPLKMNLLHSLKPPSNTHPFGTDNYGRDILSRVVYGARVALGVGVAATFINMIFGGTLGIIAGYYKGLVDSVIMRFFEIINSIPYFVLMLLVVSSFGGGAVVLVVVLGIFGLRPARIIRSSTLSVREEDYVEASRSSGASDLRIIFRHVLVNTIAPLMITSTMRIGINIILIAGLSFLGLGISPPTPTWGGMLNRAQEFIRVSWWMPFFPGIFIVATVFGFNMVGDALRDALDPRTRRMIS